MGSAFLRSRKLVDRARIVMQDLMEKTGETANLGLAEDDCVVFVSQVETHQAIRAFFRPGTRSPFHASGIGKAVLAHLEPERVAAIARKAGGETIRQIGAALGIAPSCVSKWTKRRLETGSVAPAQIGGYKPRALSGAVADWLRERIKSGPFTLRGLAAELVERGVKTDQKAVWVFVHDEGLSFKKNTRGRGADAP